MHPLTLFIFLLFLFVAVNGTWKWIKPGPELKAALERTVAMAVSNMKKDEDKENYANSTEAVLFGKCLNMRGIICETRGNYPWYERKKNTAGETRAREFGVSYVVPANKKHHTAPASTSGTGSVQFVPLESGKNVGTPQYTRLEDSAPITEVTIVPTPPEVVPAMELVKFHFTRRVEETGTVQRRIEKPGQQNAKVVFGNLARTVFSAGIATPWAIRSVGRQIFEPNVESELDPGTITYENQEAIG